MGGLVSYMASWVIPSRTLDTTPDPGTGLSEQDVHLIKTTWALASEKKVIKENGINFFLTLFRESPYMQDMFVDFKDLPEDKVATHPKMRAHALTVMYSIGNYVENLDDTETLVGLVEKIAASHVHRDIRKKDFENLEKAFLKFLGSLLGDQCTPDIVQAWRRLLQAQTAIVSKVEKEIDQQS